MVRGLRSCHLTAYRHTRAMCVANRHRVASWLVFCAARFDHCCYALMGQSVRSKLSLLGNIASIRFVEDEITYELELEA